MNCFAILSLILWWNVQSSIPRLHCEPVQRVGIPGMRLEARLWIDGLKGDATVSFFGPGLVANRNQNTATIHPFIPMDYLDGSEERLLDIWVSARIPTSHSGMRTLTGLCVFIGRKPHVVSQPSTDLALYRNCGNSIAVDIKPELIGQGCFLTFESEDSKVYPNRTDPSLVTVESNGETARIIAKGVLESKVLFVDTLCFRVIDLPLPTLHLMDNHVDLKTRKCLSRTGNSILSLSAEFSQLRGMAKDLRYVVRGVDIYATLGGKRIWLGWINGKGKSASHLTVDHALFNDLPSGTVITFVIDQPQRVNYLNTLYELKMDEADRTLTAILC